MAESTVSRALRALPLLLSSAFMIFAFRFAAPLAEHYGPSVEAGVLDAGEGQPVIPLITRFYGVPAFDAVLAQIMIAFAQILSWPADVKGYWHMLVFLLEFTGLYACMLLESCRGGYKGSKLLRFPGIIFLLGQFVTVGSVFPIYLFILYATTSAAGFTQADRFIPVADAQAMLPAIVLGYLSSAIPSLLHPNLLARQWWCWLWQLYPIWTALFFRPLSKIFGVEASSTSKPVSSASASMPAIRRTIFALVALGTVTYWYTLLASGLSLSQLYLPDYFLETPPSPPVALRTVIRYDYLTTYAATLLWLVLELRDVKKTAGGSGMPGFVTLGTAGVAAALVLGPGSVLTLGWWWREEMLVKKGKAVGKKE